MCSALERAYTRALLVEAAARAIHALKGHAEEARRSAALVTILGITVLAYLVERVPTSASRASGLPPRPGS